MRRLALVIFEEESQRDTNGSKLKSFFQRMRRFFCLSIKDDSINRVEAGDNLELFIIKLPYTLSEITGISSLRLNKVQEAISKVCNSNSIDKCFLPECFPQSSNLKGCIRNPFSGKFIYTALFVKVLELALYSKKDEIRGLDIVIMAGKGYNLLYFFIELLSPIVRFITIITNEKEYIEKKTEEIFDETGLAVRVTNDINNCVESADVIINLAEGNNIYLDRGVDSKAVVINYGQTLTDNFLPGSFVVNGIEICLTNKIAGNIKMDISRFFKNIEVAEIIMCHKLNIDTNIFENYSDYSNIEAISKQFEADGYKITGLLGRRNILKTGDIIRLRPNTKK